MQYLGNRALTKKGSNSFSKPLGLNSVKPINLLPQLPDLCSIFPLYCNNEYIISESKNVLFCQIPGEPWLNNIKQQGQLLSEKIFCICEDHFEKNSFERSLELGLLPCGKRGVEIAFICLMLMIFNVLVTMVMFNMLDIISTLSEPPVSTGLLLN